MRAYKVGKDYKGLSWALGVLNVWIRIYVVRLRDKGLEDRMRAYKVGKDYKGLSWALGVLNVWIRIYVVRLRDKGLEDRMRAYKVGKDYKGLSWALGVLTSSTHYINPHSSLSLPLSFVLLGTPRVISVGVWEARREHVCVQGLKVHNQDQLALRLVDTCYEWPLVWGI